MGKKTSNVGSGTWVESEMFESKAFLSLKGFAPQLLILLLGYRDFEPVTKAERKKGRKRGACKNCDSLTFTYIKAEKDYGITKPRLTRAFDELLAKGFIKVKYQGGARKQDKSIYSLLEKWRLWKPGIVFEKRERDSVQRGFRKPKREKVTYETVPIHAHESVPIENDQNACLSL